MYGASLQRLRFVPEVYEDPLVHPQDESYWGNVNPIGVVVVVIFSTYRHGSGAICVEALSLKQCIMWENKQVQTLLSRVSTEGSRVVIEGFVSFSEEAIATPPAAETKAAGDEDDDSDVDLFSEESEEEKRVVEERAAAVKVYGKKKPGFHLCTFMGHSASVMSLNFHPNKDDLICLCDGDGEIRHRSINNSSCARVVKRAEIKMETTPMLQQTLCIKKFFTD
ncbi:transcriptional corepressor LEUNIG isoform X1 [Tanacetum coccineum]|uniref:Transcriptional corepressor LEUNIG isoform X1 n=1 Tax=Tanacetum coccineum TaxID=301880 RepID=A0ABQ4ZVD0_9ASTR